MPISKQRYMYTAKKLYNEKWLIRCCKTINSGLKFSASPGLCTGIVVISDCRNFILWKNLTLCFSYYNNKWRDSRSIFIEMTLCNNLTNVFWANLKMVICILILLLFVLMRNWKGGEHVLVKSNEQPRHNLYRGWEFVNPKSL